jgi:diadenosine tetraphosphate (Ap4A) HIT family hydrolase
VVLVADPDYPVFCRVILNRHVSEMTDLETGARERLMRVVFATEAAVRRVMQPDKINLASFGNMVPHLHWHVIPRYADDRHFPNSIWGEPLRASAAREIPREAIVTALQELLAR